MKLRFAGTGSPSGGLFLSAVAGGLQALSIAWPGHGQAHGWLQIASLALLASALCRLALSDLPLKPALARWRGAALCLRWPGWQAPSGGCTFPCTKWAGCPHPCLRRRCCCWPRPWGCITWARPGLAGAGAAGALAAPSAGRQPAVCRAVAAGRTHARALVHRFPVGRGRICPCGRLAGGGGAWVGVYGIGALAAFVAMRLAWLRAWPQSRWRALVGLVLLCVAVRQLPDGDHFTRSAGTLDVELLQANISQTEKFEAGRGIRDALGWYGERLLASRSPTAHREAETAKAHRG